MIRSLLQLRAFATHSLVVPIVSLSLWSVSQEPALAQEPASQSQAFSELANIDFESPDCLSLFQPTDVKKWERVKTDDGNHAYRLLGISDYQPPHRSPHSISLLKDVKVTDFELSARVKTEQTSRAHRDMCLFFGYQDPSHFYYVHLGQATDDNANQIFVVDDAPRIKISEKSNEGTPWKDDTWHKVKIVRNVASGLLEVYFDDMSSPQMVAHDKRFTWGQVGIGSFDDMGLWDDVVLNGLQRE